MKPKSWPNIHFQMTPTTIGEISQGRKITTFAAVRPLTALLTSRAAIPREDTYTSGTENTV
ncbi:hypothetical protein D9M72_545580 [compost metagenome]